MSEVSHKIERLGVVFDDESLVADAGLVAAGTLLGRLGAEGIVDRVVRLGERPGGASGGRKVLTLVAAMLVGATHIDHADRLRAGATRRVLPFPVMAPSTLGRSCAPSRGVTSANSTKLPARFSSGRGRPARVPAQNR